MPFPRIKKLKPERLVIVGNFGAGNVGDELILAGFLKKLRSEICSGQITILTADCLASAAWHGKGDKKFRLKYLPKLPTGFHSFFRFDWKESLREICHADAVIFPGGGLFTDSESFRAPLIWGIHLLTARFYWRPVFLVGQSLGPFSGFLARRFTRFCLRRSSFVAVRDVASVMWLAEFELKKRRNNLGSDSAFFLREGRELPKIKKQKKRGKQKIFVSVRDFRGLLPEFFREYSTALRELSARKNVELFFVSFEPADEATWKSVVRLTRGLGKVRTVRLPQNPEKVLGKMAEADLVIGMRLHSLISARLAGVPTVGIAYSPKVSEFQKSIDGKYLQTSDFSAEKLLELISA